MKNEYIPCAVIWYGDIKILIPSTHLGISKVNKSTIRGILGAEIDFIILEIDIDNNKFVLLAKELEENPFKDIRKYIIENGEYTGRMIAFCNASGGTLVIGIVDIGSYIERRYRTDSANFSYEKFD